MDINQEGELVESKTNTGSQIILPTEALPGLVTIIPQATRPFFPGQAIPLLLSATDWLPTIEAIQSRDQDVLGVIATKKGADEDNLSASDLYEMGTICRIHRVHQEGDQVQILLEGLQRFSVRKWIKEKAPFTASIRHYPHRHMDQKDDQKAYGMAIINAIKELLPLNPLFGEELRVFLARSDLNQPSLLADFSASLTSAPKEKLQEILETIPVQQRMEKVLEILHQEIRIAKAQMEIREHVEQEIQGHQREAILKEQLKYIQKELGISKDDRTAELDEFRSRTDLLAIPETGKKRIEDEMQKFSMLEIGSPEYGVTRNYLDWMTSLPWGKTTEDTKELGTAAKILNTHHEGLEDVKLRILEFLALGIIKGDVAGSIICLVGPPGVGKTSLGKSISQALKRKFYRFSVGGMRDEAEIKGHRRTYIGAMPGKLIQALKDTQSSNPVIMLDEIDKIGNSYQGDPASALLEVLDPEQNVNFRDHYLDIEFDLSKTLFICTANQLDTIPEPLLDRMEIIHLSGYLDQEKQRISRKHLIPRQLAKAGLTRSDIKIESAALKKVIDGYSRESGIRRLDNAIASIIRKSALSILEGAKKPIIIQKDHIEPLLGNPIYRKEALQQGIGVITGLAWTPLGGATLPVEATLVHNHGAGMTTTGQLGQVMEESANIAYSYIVSNQKVLGIPEGYLDKAHIHLHVPAGATPKDGPSAGITMASALLSLATGKKVRAKHAMTGELTLTGKIYPVGGIREKLLAAKRQNLKNVILPEANQGDYLDVPAHIRKGIKVKFVDTFEALTKLVFY